MLQCPQLCLYAFLVTPSHGIIDLFRSGGFVHTDEPIRGYRLRHVSMSRVLNVLVIACSYAAFSQSSQGVIKQDQPSRGPHSPHSSEDQHRADSVVSQAAWSDKDGYTSYDCIWRCEDHALIVFEYNTSAAHPHTCNSHLEVAETFQNPIRAQYTQVHARYPLRALRHRGEGKYTNCGIRIYLRLRMVAEVIRTSYLCTSHNGR